ncbi:MAG: flagellar FliJ family protein [Lachnospiraceae bacterium]|nr:flagellar FliJ family protein [Lachnospiraceae bacterium]
MLELKRILWNGKTLLLFGILILLHGIFFVFQCNGEKSITPVGEELTAYIDGYDEYMTSVQDNVIMMKENPLFSESDSFVYRNLIKTGEDYREIADITPVAGENRGIMAVFQFTLSSFILLLIGVYIVLCFLAERQKGLYLLVRCTERGRTILSLQRIGILCLGVFGAAVILYGSIFVISVVIFPGCDMARPVQSVPELGNVIGQYSIGTYLMLFVLRKALGCLFACLLLYFCMSLFRSSFCVAAFFLLLLGEYALYAFIIPTGRWSVFKYINLYTYTFCGTDYAHYYNLNVLGTPMNIVGTSDLFVVLGTVVMVVVCTLQYARQYPRSEYRTLKVIEKLRVFVSRHKPSGSLMTWELKKVLFSQKGLFIMALMIYLAYSASVESNYMDFRSRYVVHWYEEFAGEITEESVQRMRDTRTEMEEEIKMWEESLARQEQYKIEHMMKGWDVTMIDWFIQNLQKAIEENKRQITGLNVVLKQAEDGLMYALESGRSVMLIDSGAYELLLQNDKQTIFRNYLYTLLAVVLVLSGIMACEKSAHMEMLLHSMYRGRGQVMVRKILILLGVCIVTTLSIHLVQYFQIGEVLTFADKEVPVQSIPCVRNFPFPLTIGQYLYFIYGVRVVMSILMGSAVMYLSSKFSRITTLAFGVFLLLVPMGLVAMRF